VVMVAGDVRTAEFIPAWEEMTFKQAVAVAGGRNLGSRARGVYLTRDGLKRYFTSLAVLDEREEPQPGDIITLSPDI
jgi:protein involved in polysaccharide export with SLBB domain